ncbi:hypothetical protein GGI01_002972 [Coemansia sp. RSA 376]|nr:hypothetical protein H4S03_006561 [Coemansia sp. S3946]KAJ2047226.1 hypothetical protein H4S04_004577 [Coemansia sp. S16]KAJ2067724.1 hypothetical protein GGI08_001235 [Coemansia sp. S2]KAJ2070015.1 hypothetical protein GGH13_004326 [Coemansia sp. S155-1]KAJ2102179.1 hypothetical protein GGI09_001355 [Coemansia sp. S100]KAJ2106311.1 hypothetical protein IW146_007840 [Coemansia sp. RSA 922]KAJ2260473.1 hypothetical protein GGI01_002972 [Coemansia sp. RSA 376]KAJ2429746.1 hypothetical prote
MASRIAPRLVLTMFTHSRCQLCVTAKEALEIVHQRVPFEMKEVDIRQPGNEKWFEEYKFDVPVIHANDEFLLWHRVNVDDTVAKLQEIIKNAAREPSDKDDDL